MQLTDLGDGPSIRRMLLRASLTLVLWLTTLAWSQRAAQVAVVPIERRAIEITQPLVATVSPVTRTTVAAEQEGIVEQRMFDEGQHVEKGAVLARVNTDLLKSQLDAAIAAKRTAEAELETARLTQENAQREVERLTQLFESRVAPEKEFRDAMTMRDIAVATVATRAARIAERTAEVERLQTMMNKAQTHAPLSGVISRRYVEVGQWIDKGAPIADLLQLDPLFVDVNVPEEVIARVRRGDPARVQIDALRGRNLTGTVDQIIPLADASSRTFRVRILLQNPDLSVWPGFFARAALFSRTDERQFIVPQDAIVTRGSSHHVVVVRDGKSAIVPVTLGRAEAGGVSVTGELRENEMVVVRGNESLMPDQMLIVMNPPTTQPQ